MFCIGCISYQAEPAARPAGNADAKQGQEEKAWHLGSGPAQIRVICPQAL